MVSFAVQKLVTLIRSHLFVLFLFLLPWDTDLVNKNIDTIYVRKCFAYAIF